MIREFLIDIKTLNKYLELTVPPRNKRSSHHSAEPFRKIIIKSLQQKTKVAHIFSVSQEQEYSRSFPSLKDYIWKLQKEEDMNRKETKKTKFSRSRLTFIFDQSFTVNQKKKKISKDFLTNTAS
ncbi:hypothetical protein ACFY5J_04690 [Peribacillus butanolivorans]|uniref:hypothetical protein n=1 Tax=Peribacillus butanolivorans TaxID=421767 RepID=UPI0036C59738